MYNKVSCFAIAKEKASSCQVAGSFAMLCKLGQRRGQRKLAMARRTRLRPSTTVAAAYYLLHLTTKKYKVLQSKDYDQVAPASEAEHCLLTEQQMDQSVGLWLL